MTTGSPRPLHEIATWVFDLDNTLYSRNCDLFPQIHVKMGEFIARHLGVGLEEARRMQKEYFLRHGTTLRGMMVEHGLEPRAFLDYVHDIDLASVPPDLALGAALAELPGRKIVFTNGSVRHAERVLARLGIDGHFSGIFDIEAASYLPKPDPAGYLELIRRFEFDPAAAAMVEDMAKNLKPAAALGMTTVWVRGGPDWASEGAEEGHIHHVVDDLAPFLVAAAAAKDAAAG
jgi:putative hydrolase of the HAD superfamily